DLIHPNVQVYSYNPVVKGKKNILHCYVDGFHPPEIKITFQKNGVLIEKVETTELTFRLDWTFELLAYIPIVPDGKSNYSCIVVHSSITAPKNVTWGECFAP
uniref:Beta-2-microglobulin n=1 Tax=Anolis carolinensis TaxID=28377 RepID=H9GC47_ANOCA